MQNLEDTTIEEFKKENQSKGLTIIMMVLGIAKQF
jgi:hypothetical protein